MSRSNLKALPAEPQRRAARDELAKAIQQRDKAQADVDKIRAAQEQLWQQIIDATSALGVAEKALKTAEEEAPMLIASRILGEPPDADVLDVKTAREQLASAEEDLKNLRDAKEPLDAALKDVEEALFYASQRVEDRIKQVVASDPATSALFDCLKAASPTYLGVTKVLGYLERRDALPEERGKWTTLDDYRNGEPYIQKWQVAMRALETDADAQLPALP